MDCSREPLMAVVKVPWKVVMSELNRAVSLVAVKDCLSVVPREYEWVDWKVVY